MQESMQQNASAKNGFGFVVILCMLVLLGAAGLGYMILSSAENTYSASTEHVLLQQAQDRMSRVTNWFGAVQSQLEAFAQQDRLVLTCYQVYSERENLNKIFDRIYEITRKNPKGILSSLWEEAAALSPAAGPAAPAEAAAASPAASAATEAPAPGNDTAAPAPGNDTAAPTPGNDTAAPTPGDGTAAPARGGNTAHDAALIDDTARQILVMRQALQNHVNKNRLVSMALLTPGGEPFVSSLDALPKLPQDIKLRLDDVALKGRMLMMPARRSDDGLLLVDVLSPVKPGRFVQPGDPPVIGILLTTLDVTSAVQGFLERTRGSAAVQGRLLQHTERGVVSLAGLPGATDSILTGWLPTREGNLTFGEREIDGNKVYAVGMYVPGLPWIVAADIAVSTARRDYEHFREMALILLVAGTIILLLCTCGGWWWFVGKRERAINDQVRALYRQNTQQKLLVENINTHLTDAIVLKDRAGRILFCNEAYAAFFGKPVKEIVGQNADELMCVMTNLPVNPHVLEVLNTGKSTHYSEVLELPQGRTTFQVVCSPYRNEARLVIGVVCVYRDLSAIMQAHERTQKMAHQTIQVLVRAIEAADPYLAGQSMRLSELSQTLVRMLGLDAVHVATVRSAASLSQVGMLRVPAALRTKQGVLSGEERAELRKHVVYAQEMLEGLDFGIPLQEAMGQMHEHMDGSGYPHGLKGDEICIDARILAVANTFCAVLRPRAYRQARGVEEALKILSPDNPQYDAEVVRVLHAFVRGPLGPRFVESVIEAK